MESNELIGLLNSGINLLSVVKSLGLHILANREQFESEKYAAQADLAGAFRAAVAAESTAMWRPDGTPDVAMSDALRAQFRRIEPTPALATVKTLEGLCLGAARLFFQNASTVVELSRGHIVPLPRRWLAELATTPNPATTHPDPLLDSDTGAVLWDSDWVLELDYTFRDRLDDVCAPRRPRADRLLANGMQRLAHSLPTVATIHPWDRQDMAEAEDVSDGRFFNVHPIVPDSRTQSGSADDTNTDAAVFATLAAFGPLASIAVLPEVCLHSPDGLGERIAENFDNLPPLIVAGTAHTGDRGDRTRANTSQVYLDGVPLLRVNKRVPFVLRTSTEALTEDIAPQAHRLRLAAGTATRLAVAICADVNWAGLHSAMASAAVNLLLSPSWTPLLGAAGGALTGLATYGQCLGVVANTPEHRSTAAVPPFWACTAGPYDGGRFRLHYAAGPPPQAGVLNPNVAFDDAKHFRWVSMSTGTSSSEGL